MWERQYFAREKLLCIQIWRKQSRNATKEVILLEYFSKRLGPSKLYSNMIHDRLSFWYKGEDAIFKKIIWIVAFKIHGIQYK